MSKKRLHEIAKEIGKSSKEVVEQAKSLGLDVKSHASSVEEADAKKIVSSFSKASKPIAKTSQSITKPVKPATINASEPSRSDKPKAIAQSVAAQKQAVTEVAEKPAVTKPKSRNFKAEREARAKEQAARRQAGGTNRSEDRRGDSRQANRGNSDQDRRGHRSQGQSKDRRFDQRPSNGSNRNDNRQQTGNRDRNRSFTNGNRQNDRFADNRRQEQAQPSGPRIDFKARAAALKAEQNAEYSRQSESRFREQEEAKRLAQVARQEAKEAALQAQAEENNRREASAKTAEPVVAMAAPVAAVTKPSDNRRKKQTRPEKNRDMDHHSEEGQKKNKKSWNSQNQVRNQKNSNWNKNKKTKKGKNTKNTNTAPKPVTERKFHELPKEFEYTEGMTVAEIAKRIKREPAEIVKKLFMMGVMATQNQSLDGDTIELLMVDYGIEAKAKVEVDDADIERFFEDENYLNPENIVERAPVVTIMGHVDHGKTTLLDTLRNSRVATGEAGGITQHIGAYQIEEAGKKITFLDTPGHAAFTSMRARGASVTDITILIVAADDGVMPQTIEAINHSKAAGVPIIVAINKIDKPGANPERVIAELAEYGIISTAWGGDSEFVEISAKFNKNIDELLETVLLVAEVEELKADPTVRAIGTVIEARLDKGKGAIATLLVQQGTLHVQDPIVVGNTFGRVRAMVNDLGRRVKSAEPSTPVSITGLNETPMAGDHFAVYADEKAARAAGEERSKRALLKQRQNTQRVSLDNLFDTLKAGEIKTVNVIIKADVQGSVEALAASLVKIDVEGVRVNVVHSAVGAINESDVTLAEASNAVIIGFNVRPTPQARQQADTDDVEIRLHSIIYKVIEEVEEAMKGKLDPVYQEKILGEAIIRETFKVSKVGTIGGFMVINGKVTRDSSVRVIRDSVVIFDGKLASLKHYKDDVKEVGNAQEGGLMIENFNDLKVDDTIEAYIMEEIVRK
ncbi:translation initiation factor IF-2 [Streptococcus dysgalactiae]|uniref:Translation initiation factor IF-2 n=3 Tax=Streptococcus TaxID=1301 RepID=A0AB38XZL4_STREQ|nr:translation initiation factor IF-2 [Streptococcus dysgalactiae]EGR88346.1 translation initiation factor IF-2 [Streptococcus dysgalactiae subsp. equisimilis SK1250]MCY7207910.1 translation initiation factor IF-2 [Streptococcus dysgalactiae]OBY97007.1 translation initiation factor IF-2 [Streptococcus dysgalactiae subsp. equisimilis]OCX02871.1 translation initiation factor IF-2 [Streptococcus dysgalactiae subsp. equisimilis]OCX05673.1 translation initiation factor IF-2 [Streptococcus dysgalact